MADVVRLSCNSQRFSYSLLTCLSSLNSCQRYLPPNRVGLQKTAVSVSDFTSVGVYPIALRRRHKLRNFKSGVSGCIRPAECGAVSITKISCFDDQAEKCKRRALIVGMGALTLNPFRASPLLAQGIPEKYNLFVDKVDGYSYYYPSDWRDFDFLGHDSAFKDRSLQLQNVRLSFIPTNKSDVRELGLMDEVVFHLVNDVYSAPNQVGDILDMQEKNIDGRNYWTFEYVLTSPNFSRAAFATIAIANGRYYTLIVGANQRRWRKYRNMLKVVADSFKVMEI